MGCNEFQSQSNKWNVNNDIYISPIYTYLSCLFFFPPFLATSPHKTVLNLARLSNHLQDCKGKLLLISSS